ncbi:MAG: hypothetical protein RLZZ585_336 [Bacteroidota bacterium]|jgi:hypothetical protein
MNYLKKISPVSLLLFAFLCLTNFVFSQKAHIEPEVYVPVPMEELPFFNNDELALEKAQQVSDFQMRIYAFASSNNQMAKLSQVSNELDLKLKKLCPNYPGSSALDADRKKVERWVLDFPEEVVYFDGLLNTILFRLGETN